MKRSVLVALTLVVAATAFVSPLQRDLFIGDETKYGQIIWEMRESGSLLVPQLEGRPYTHKPPVHFWMVWALTLLFGTESIWPFVIPSLVAGGVLIWLVGVLARELFGGAEWETRFVLASFWLVWGLAQTARMDLQFAAAISGAALLIWRWGRTDRRAQLYGAAALIALAILIKGPMAFVMVVILLAAESVRWRKGWRREYLVALLITAAICLAWVVPAALAGGSEYSRELLVEQNVGRAVSAWTHSEPPWFYLAHYPVTFLPWSPLGIVAVVAIWKRPTEERATRFCLDWLLAVVIPFSLLSGKLDVYMVPAMIPLALLTGRYLAGGVEDSLAAWGRGLSRMVVAMFGLIFAAAIAIGPRFLEPANRALIADPIVRALFWTTVIAAAVGLALQIARRDVLWNAAVAALVTLVPLVVLAAFLMPMANRAVSSGPLAREIARHTTRGEEVGLYGTPHLWARDLPRSLRRVQHLGAGALAPDSGIRPRFLAARRDKAPELGAGLGEYRRIGGVNLKGKEIDVYRRN